MSSFLKWIRNSLCKFSGEDFAIIRKCNIKIQFYFSFIGLFVLTILICCLLSAVYFTEHLFHNWILDIGIGIVWGYIVTNMYVLLLYTITPTLLPVKDRRKKKTEERRTSITLSMGLRIFMVILLAIITAQPLSVWLLKPDSVALANDIKELLREDRKALAITVFVIVVFLFPVYLKYNIRKLGEFYDRKGAIKKRIIEEDYQHFKMQYKMILADKIATYNRTAWSHLMPYLDKMETVNPESYERHLADVKKELINEDCSKYEYWANPPYRTKHKKSSGKSHSEKKLLRLIYPESD